MKQIICLLSIFVIFLASCNSTTKYSYDYTKLKQVAIELKEVYAEMDSIYYSSKNREKWYESKENIISRLDTIQESIDELSPVEKDPEEKNSKEFNDLLYTPRSIYNQLQDIEFLFYDTANNGNFKYFETVINDQALEARLDHLIERCENKGVIIPLDAEYKNIPPPSVETDADITVEFSNIKD